MNNKTLIKKLPLLTVLAASLVLAPVIAMAGNSDHSQSRSKYSHDDRRSHGKSHVRSEQHRVKRSYKNNARSHGKNHKSGNRHSSSYHYDRGHGHQNNYVHYKHHQGENRHDHRTTYIVNDHYYNDDFYGLDQLRFMIGLHTNNFDIVFRD